MKQGKIQESILDRAVLKRIKHRRSEVITTPAAGMDFAAACSGAGIQPDAVFVSHMNTMCGSAEECGQLAVLKAAAGLWAQGAKVYGVHISVLMPETAGECELRTFVDEAEAACAEADIEIMGGHTQVSPSVEVFAVTVCAHGFLAKDKVLSKRHPGEGDDLVVAGCVGLSGTAVLARRAFGLLTETYNSDFIDEAAGFFKLCSVKKAAGIVSDFDVTAVHDISSTGIFGALWEMAVQSHRGFVVDIKKIPIRQETVEICNYFDLNPYRLESAGALLIAAPHGEQLVHLLREAGIMAAVIGSVTGSNDKLILNDDEKGCMEPPKCSELSKVEWRNVR